MRVGEFLITIMPICKVLLVLVPTATNKHCGVVWVYYTPYVVKSLNVTLEQAMNARKGSRDMVLQFFKFCE
jgi:hypothetical protein